MNVIGTCSICGGQVCTPELWSGVGAPIPTCTRCGAVAASSGPIIPMRRVEEQGRMWSGSGIPEAMYRQHAIMDTRWKG